MTNREQFADVNLFADGVAHRFGRNVLFRNVSTKWDGGTSAAIVGANGSGKSTLVRILAGLLTPWRGHVRMSVSDRAVPGEERPYHVGLVAPYLQVYDGLSLRENLTFLHRARGLSGDSHAIAEGLIEHVELSGREDDLVGTFSSGMKQRARLAAALIASPPILLLDEPGTNLDESGRSLIRRVGDDQIARGGILIVATNDAAEADWCVTRLDIDALRDQV